MKVIDLLNKIANGEEVPEKIQVYSDIFILDYGNMVYEHEKTNTQLLSIYNGNILNYEVRIKEEDKKIEKITLDDWVEFTTIGDMDNIDFMFNKNSRTFVDKINEIIDCINKEDK